jgi:hypothetical protein
MERQNSDLSQVLSFRNVAYKLRPLLTITEGSKSRENTKKLQILLLKIIDELDCLLLASYFM